MDWKTIHTPTVSMVQQVGVYFIAPSVEAR